MSYHQHTNCRVCASERLIPYLDLGNLPLTNNLCDTADEVAETYPLKVLLCEECGLSQLSIVVDPNILFGHYVYRSSISQGYKDHCFNMANDLKEMYDLNENSFHIDIAGNDGALLNEFRKVIGGKVLNIDPAQNLYEINESQDIRMYCAFWGVDAAKHLISTQWTKADLITATNVFAHVDKVKEFLEAVKMVLSDTGVLILEFPYLVDFIEKGEFDTIYQEHLSYFGITPLSVLCDKLGLTIMRVEKQEIHGGTVRVHIGYGEQHVSVLSFKARETPYLSLYPYTLFSEAVREAISTFDVKLNRLKAVGFKIAAFAASAKFNTLLNCTGITSDVIDYIIDETPEKLGKYSPGTKIPIVEVDTLRKDPPDYLVLGSWNFRSELISKAKLLGYKGRFIVPIPYFKIIE